MKSHVPQSNGNRMLLFWVPSPLTKFKSPAGTKKRVKINVVVGISTPAFSWLKKKVQRLCFQVTCIATPVWPSHLAELNTWVFSLKWSFPGLETEVTVFVFKKREHQSILFFYFVRCAVVHQIWLLLHKALGFIKDLDL